MWLLRAFKMSYVICYVTLAPEVCTFLLSLKWKSRHRSLARGFTSRFRCRSHLTRKKNPENFWDQGYVVLQSSQTRLSRVAYQVSKQLHCTVVIMRVHVFRRMRSTLAVRQSKLRNTVKRAADLLAKMIPRDGNFTRFSFENNAFI